MKKDTRQLKKDITSAIDTEEKAVREENEEINKQEKTEDNSKFTFEQAFQFADEKFKDDEDIGYGLSHELEYENGEAYYSRLTH